jgi:glycosyltransferase involved in cell wall biosynthesis
MPRGAPRGAGFYASLPAAVVSEVRRFRPDVVVAQSPYEAAAVAPTLRLLRPRPKLVTEVHGDPRTATRLYGSPLRRLLAVPSDRVAMAGLRAADATRAVSSSTAAIARQVTGCEPAAIFPTYFDLESFLRNPTAPLPDRPRAIWVGALQRTKNPGLIMSAWRIVAERLPDARLCIVGRGPLQSEIDAFAAEFQSTVEVISWLSPPELAERVDGSTLLTMTSDSEGLPRVILEAFARGRAVVSTAVGGIPDAVVPERNGLLVAPRDAPALADALERVLADRALAERLGRGAGAAARRFDWTPSRYAAALHDLVDEVCSNGRQAGRRIRPGADLSA